MFSTILCKYRGHKYRFVRAWEAENIIYKDQGGINKCILLSKTNDELSQQELISLVKEDQLLPEYSQRRYLINLKCVKCKHRITIEDTLYFTNSKV